MSQPRPAAAVLLARDSPDAPELFMVRRPSAAAAFADAWVFPGGSVRPDDAGDTAGVDALAELTRRGGTPPTSAEDARALWWCALRELYEEAGVLLADGALPPDARDRVHQGASFPDLLREHRVQPDHTALVYFSHWITPDGLPRRFDTRFFAAALPADQLASHCGVETTAGAWLTPRDALEKHHAGNLPLVLPTRAHLERLAPCRSVAEVLHLAASKRVRTVQPTDSRVDVDEGW